MDILDRFIIQARKNIESGYYGIAKERDAIEKASLRETLMTKNFSLIAEIKHASPAGEYSFDGIGTGIGIDVEKAAAAFKDAGADAISVVVEPKIFKGSIHNVATAKKTGLPVLFKDFIIDETQIRAAAAAGADCILLIARVADRLGLDLAKLIDTAHSYGLEVLLECYDEKEMKKAAATEADIVGINNRDLQTLNVDITRTARVMRAAREAGKAHQPAISESGIKTRQDAEFVKAAGVKGILVGTALWKTGSQAEKIRELRLK